MDVRCFNRSERNYNVEQRRLHERAVSIRLSSCRRVGRVTFQDPAGVRGKPDIEVSSGLKLDNVLIDGAPPGRRCQNGVATVSSEVDGGTGRVNGIARALHRNRLERLTRSCEPTRSYPGSISLVFQ